MSAAVRFRPTPPALRLNSITGTWHPQVTLNDAAGNTSGLQDQTGTLFVFDQAAPTFTTGPTVAATFLTALAITGFRLRFGGSEMDGGIVGRKDRKAPPPLDLSLGRKTRRGMQGSL